MEVHMKEVEDYVGYFATMDGHIIGKRGHVLAGKITWDGYKEIILSDCSRRRSVRVHTLVWETYKGKVPKGLQINHKDGNKLNNALDNLEVVTNAQNVRHAFLTGLYPSKDFKGKRIPSSLTRTEICVMQRMRDDGCTYKEISDVFNLGGGDCYVGEILSGKKLAEISGL
jgi:hypothetical protein